MDVQKVDFKDLNAPDKFTNSLHETGFSVLTNHPVDINLIKTVMQIGNRFSIIVRKINISLIL